MHKIWALIGGKERKSCGESDREHVVGQFPQNDPRRAVPSFLPVVCRAELQTELPRRSVRSCVVFGV